MKRLMAVLFGMLLATAPLADAATTLDTVPFTITYTNNSGTGEPDISLVAQTPLTLSISLDTLNRELQYWPAIDQTGEVAVNGSGHASLLLIDVHAGYRVTGVSVHALAYGELVPGQLDGYPPGVANNSASLNWTLAAPGTTLPFAWQLDNFSGLQPFALASGPLALDGSFQIDLLATVWAQALAAGGDGSYAQSMALASIGNAILNIEVAAIPEPGTYAMLLAGLAVLGWPRRKIA